MSSKEVFIDSNVLIYAKNKDSLKYKKSRIVLRKMVKESMIGVITPYVVNEVHYSFIRDFGKIHAGNFIKDILSIPNTQLVDISLDANAIFSIVKLSKLYNLRTFDAYHAYYCKYLGITKIATFDKDFERVKFLKNYVS